jgi:hypothetical protein
MRLLGWPEHHPDPPFLVLVSHARLCAPHTPCLFTPTGRNIMN